MPFAVWNNCYHCAWAQCSFFPIWLSTSLNKIQRPKECTQWLLYVFGKSRNANSHSILSWLLNSERGEGKKPFRQDSIKRQLFLELSVAVKQGKHKCHPLLKYCISLPSHSPFCFKRAFLFLEQTVAMTSPEIFLRTRCWQRFFCGMLDLPSHTFLISQKSLEAERLEGGGQWKLLRPCACLSSPGREVSK